MSSSPAFVRSLIDQIPLIAGQVRAVPHVGSSVPGGTILGRTKASIGAHGLQVANVLERLAATGSNLVVNVGWELAGYRNGQNI